MENLKHTPGPWKLAGGDNSNFEINIGETTCSVTCYDKNTGYHQISRDEMESNAKLIAASPELLEMCNMLYMVGRRAYGKSFDEWPEAKEYFKVFKKATK